MLRKAHEVTIIVLHYAVVYKYNREFRPDIIAYVLCTHARV